MSSRTDERALVNVTSDGGVRKTILTEGVGEEAGRGAKVTIKYSLHLRDGDGDGALIDTSEGRLNNSLTFTQGRRKVIGALEVIVQGMLKGEKCRALVDTVYAFGSKGLKRKNVPENAPLVLYVEMLEFEGGETQKALSDMSARERFDQAKVCKENGNAFFKELKYEKAMVQYSQCIDYVSNVFSNPASKVNSQLSTASEQSHSVAGTTENGTDGHAEDGENDDQTEEGFSEAVIADEAEAEEIEILDVSTATAAGHSLQNNDESHAHANGQVHDGMEPSANSVASKAIDSDSQQQESEHISEVPHDSNNVATPNEEENDDPNEKEVRSLHVAALNNLSLCLVKMEQFKQAVESATHALIIEPDSSKAYYYR